MTPEFKKLLVENIDSAVHGLHLFLGTKGSLTDIGAVSQTIVSITENLRDELVSYRTQLEQEN